MNIRIIISLLFAWTTLPLFADWKSGQAKVDITGPVIGTATMGYSVPNAIGNGLHQRLYARAFSFEDAQQNLFFMVHTDTCFVTMALKDRVIKNLKSLLPHAGITLSLIHI